jgi:uncharacterized membrane protein YeaQ/YmgE (transglycosylase-associated protein family)
MFLVPMSFVAWIVLGLLVGAIAKFGVPARGANPGCVGTFAVAVAGGLLGGLLSTGLGFGGAAGNLDWRNLAVAVLGAIVLVLFVRWLVQRRSGGVG